VIAMKKAPAEWNEKTVELIAWFETTDLATEPFSLNPWTRVADPERCYEALRLDIEAGPRGPRAEALVKDLQELKAVRESWLRPAA